MATLEELNSNFERLDPMALIQQTVEDNKDLFVELNKEQLLTGYDAAGERLKPYKNRSYARRKFRQNPVPGEGNPDFYLTGRFFSGFKIEVAKSDAKLLSTDSKYKILIERDPNVFGLNETKKKELIDGGFKESMQKNLRKTVKLE